MINPIRYIKLPVLYFRSLTTGQKISAGGGVGGTEEEEKQGLNV